MRVLGKIRRLDADRVVRWSGRAVFAAWLVLWVSRSIALLPYDYGDLCYLFSLEDGIMVPQEWVHPLFVPALDAYRSVLGFFGYSGKMLLPVEVLNLGVALATLTGLFLFVERWCGDAIAAALSVLTLGFSLGYWGGCLRPTPYALGAACVAACLMTLIGPVRRRDCARYALAGAACGCAISLHASAISLIPVAAVAAFLETGSFRKTLRPFAAFLAPALLVSGLAYACLIVWHGITPEYVLGIGFKELFWRIEQIPGTSIYSSGDPVGQITGYFDTFWVQARGLLTLTALLSVVAVFAGRMRGTATDFPIARAYWTAAANFLFFSAFFVINNNQNGFIFAGMLMAPLVLALAIVRVSWLRWLFVPAAVAVLHSSVLLVSGSGAGAAKEPILGEAGFLAARLGPRDIVLVPGCPFPELLYLRHFNILRIGTRDGFGDSCQVPQVETGPALDERLSAYLRDGRKVYFYPGDLETDFSSVRKDRQRMKQVILSLDEAPRDRSENIAALLKRLDESFEFEQGPVSPGGMGYLRLTPRNKRGKRPKATQRAVPAEIKPDFARIREVLGDGCEHALFRKRTAYLENWLSVAHDSYALEDLAVVLADLLSDESPVEAGRLHAAALTLIDPAFLTGGIGSRLRQVEGLENLLNAAIRMRKTAGMLTRACESARDGRESEASRAVAQARSVYPAYADFHLSRNLGASEAPEDAARIGAACGAAPPDGAARWLLRAVKDAEGMKKEAVELFLAGERRAADAKLEAALRSNPDDIEVLMSRGAVLMSLDRVEEAIRCYDAIMGLGPGRRDTLASAYMARATARFRSKRIESARADARKALKTASPGWNQRDAAASFLKGL